MADLEEGGIERRSRRFAAATGVLAAVIVGAFAVTMAQAFAAPSGDRPALPVLYAVYWLPTLFYLGALWAIRRIFVEIGRGRLFAASVARGLRRAGWALLGGGAFNLLVVRVVQNATLPGGFSFGDAHAFRGLNFDPAYVMLMLIGLALLLLSSLFRVAAEQRERARTLAAELDEFL